MRDRNDPYVPGDIISGIGKVDTIHCGLPWVPTMVSGVMVYVMGAINVIGDFRLRDALDGHILGEEEIQERTNNSRYDYSNRTSDTTERPLREKRAITQSISDRDGFCKCPPV